jgi:hypothetical protein
VPMWPAHGKSATLTGVVRSLFHSFPVNARQWTPAFIRRATRNGLGRLGNALIICQQNLMMCPCLLQFSQKSTNGQYLAMRPGDLQLRHTAPHPQHLQNGQPCLFWRWIKPEGAGLVQAVSPVGTGLGKGLLVVNWWSPCSIKTCN